MIGFTFNRLSTLFWTVFYHTAGRVFFTKLGQGSKFQGWIDIPQRMGRISIGRNVHICRQVEFSVTNQAELIIEDGTFLGRGTVISAHRRVSIGANVLVAEYVSIHDNNHRTLDQNLPIQSQGFEAESLEIGDDCWIGAKATLVKGAGLGRRCVLGAGAVLTKKWPDYTVAAGVPAQAMDKKAVVFPVAAQEEEKRVLIHNETPPYPPHQDNASNRPSPHSLRNQMGRVLWNVVWTFFYRPSPKLFHGWRRFLLRSFGARIDQTAFPYPSVKIWAPWNLEMGDHSCLSPHVDCYCVAPIKIGAHATVSQYSYLCTASHDYEDPQMPLMTGRISIEANAWVAADVFIGLGVTVHEGAVVGARSSVYRDIPSWTVVAGNPAKFIKRRHYR